MRWPRITSILALGFVCLGSQTPQGVHPHAKILGALIYTDLSVSFDGEEASGIMAQLEDDLGVLMQVYWTSKILDGCERAAAIFLKLENQPAIIVLERLIEQLHNDEEVTWQIRDGVLEVGLKSRFSKSSSHQTITYAIGDLLFDIRDFDNAPEMGTGNGGVGGGSGGGGNSGGVGFGTPGVDPESLTKQKRIDRIIELITTFVEPSQWEKNGGECTITSFNEMLIIRASNYVHRQIGGYPFVAVRPDSARKRHVKYSNGRTMVRVPGRPSQ